MSAWRKPATPITDLDLCAVGSLASKRALTFADFADARSPRLSTSTAKSVFKKMARQGLLELTGRRQWQPTEAGWARIRAASCKR